MTLKIKYTYSCDFCKVEFKEEDYEIQPHISAAETALPFPNTTGRGVGDFMACGSCRQVAMAALMKQVVNND